MTCLPKVVFHLMAEAPSPLTVLPPAKLAKDILKYILLPNVKFKKIIFTMKLYTNTVIFIYWVYID